ncbi:hypothetical protein BC829DRAFT_267793 [Chytridium lagenaria]|nr:hypothetical protein BC829DRAFT_267793 [Chytridium lagenaria]
MRWGTKNLWKTPQKKTVEVSRTGMGEHMGKITVATGPISNITVDDSVTSSSSSFLASTKPGYPGRGVPMMSDRINLRRMSSVRGGRVPLPQPPEETILPTPVGVVTPSSSVMLPTDSVRYKATQAYQTMDPEEVELSEGDIVQLDTIYLDGWSKGLNETTRQFGFIPFSVLRPL